jgi:aminoglycoside phosphotransferase (APT) family kinase protein
VLHALMRDTCHSKVNEQQKPLSGSTARVLATVPHPDILKQLEVCLIAPLGGRLNQHWLVEPDRSVKPVRERLVLRRWFTADAEDIAYELRLLSRLAALGWPVAPAAEGPVEWEGHFWSLFPFLPGEPPSTQDPISEQRERGRLLAEFHSDLTTLHDFGQRGTWRRCEEILADPTLDRVLSDHEETLPEDVRVLRWHLHRARERIAAIPLQGRPHILIHADFTPWNLRFTKGRLSGILDFELSHRDHRVGDFALSWRGKYDAILHGYDEAAPLEPEEWALLTPLWWASLIDGVCRDLQVGTRDDGWSIRKLLQRSPLMGPDAEPFR